MTPVREEALTIPIGKLELMIAFLKSVDSKTWKTVVTGWEHPTVTDAVGKVSHKLEILWSNAKMKHLWKILKHLLQELWFLQTVFSGNAKNKIK